MSGETILYVDDVRAGYSIGRRFIDAVSGVTLKLFYGEIFGLAGESGCGKSTLLRIIYGYIEPPLRRVKGSIILRSKTEEFRLHELSMDELKGRVWWRYITWIPQGAMNVLNPTIRVRDHFIEMFRLHSNIDKREAHKITVEYLEALGLSREVVDAYPTQLSGGMRQRVVIALALLFNPILVLADEPTSALDVVTQRVLLEQLLKLQEKFNFTLVLVSHDMDVHGVLTNRIGIMYAGKIVEVGPTGKVFAEPLHPYTKALIAALPRLGDRITRKGLSGSPPDLSNPPPGCRFHPRCPYAMDVCRREEPPIVDIEKNRVVSCWLYVKR
ncbi:MAG: ABC transporter ATP-binding protein [Ignisphaera sp.]|nr:ABC transporter ATP-binding protein [Ignisphaera sp.]MCX8167623.1 ABC transporter ATP-binding protein [Ignisphaera sp.]MDW8085966.1 ABC transporter ATP-binding protein [Ignisphaera sp.]